VRLRQVSTSLETLRTIPAPPMVFIHQSPWSRQPVSDKTLDTSHLMHFSLNCSRSAYVVCLFRLVNIYFPDFPIFAPYPPDDVCPGTPCNSGKRAILSRVYSVQVITHKLVIAYKPTKKKVLRMRDSEMSLTQSNKLQL
jgi:hypothetical protein